MQSDSTLPRRDDLAGEDNHAPRFQITMTGSGTVRDAEGNILNQDTPVESTVEVSEAELTALLERIKP